MKKVLYFALAAVSILSSCKKDDEDPAPSKNITLSDIYTKDGFIKGTITGKTSDNKAINKSFNFEMAEEASFQLDPNGGDTIYTIRISKLDAAGSLLTSGDNYAYLGFTLKKDKSTLIDLKRFQLSNDVTNQNNVITKFEADYYGNGTETNMVLSNVQFNPSAGTISANYTVYVGQDDNASENLATVTGSFSSKLKGVMYRKAL